MRLRLFHFNCLICFRKKKQAKILFPPQETISSQTTQFTFPKMGEIADVELKKTVKYAICKTAKEKNYKFTIGHCHCNY